MGQGGYVVIDNDTGYDWTLTYEHSYQMEHWSPWETIPAHSSRKMYVEWGESGNTGDDGAEAGYTVQDGTGRYFQLEARGRPSRHLQMDLGSYSTDDYPKNSVVNLGWIHDGTVSFQARQSNEQQLEPCFLAGSRILTSDGYRAIETLNIGDSLIAVGENGQETREVIFVGQKLLTVNQSAHLPPDEAGWPICIRKNALGEYAPTRDLWVTSEHCILLQNHFVPVRMLVNGSSIFYDFTKPAYTYYHVGTRDHSVLIAENIYTESYLYGSNCRQFSLIEEGQCSMAPVSPARPVRVERSFVEPLYQEIVSRLSPAEKEDGAKSREIVTDPDLRLILSCGTEIAPLEKSDRKAIFPTKNLTDTVFIRTRSGRPCDSIGVFIDDRRTLGVLVGQVTIGEPDASNVVEIDFTRHGLRGWHAPEAAPMRWTDGHAELVIPKHLRSETARLVINVIHNEPYLL